MKQNLGFQIEPKEVALLVIDMQNGFCHDKGTLGKNGADISSSKAIVPNVRKLVKMCWEAKIHVIWSQQKHFPEDVTRRLHKIPSHLDKIGTYPCFTGTWDAEIIDELKSEIREEDDIVEKHRSSCFYNTTLHTKLRMRGINMLIVAGVASEYCVENTIRHAYHMDYDIIVIKDCIASMHEESTRTTLLNVERWFGLVLSLKELSEQLEIT
jgi:ureidoacrylate peracid hydrolase